MMNENMSNDVNGVNGTTTDINIKIEQTWLVQRLQKPCEKPFIGINDGMLGISEDNLGILHQVFGFDYMGSAEFEFGAIPNALNKIVGFAKEGKLVRGTLQHVQRAVYYICQKGVEGYVEELVSKLAEESLCLKERTGLRDALVKPSYEAFDRVGWLEMDNGFFFFVDKDMYLQTCYLFGLINRAPKSFKKEPAKKAVPAKKQNNGSREKNHQFQSQNRRPQKPNFERDVQSEYVNALCLEKQKHPQVDVVAFEKYLCGVKIDELLEKAERALLLSQKPNSHKAYVAKAWVWAKRVKRDISRQVSAIYPQKNTLFASAEIIRSA